MVNIYNSGKIIKHILSFTVYELPTFGVTNHRHSNTEVVPAVTMVPQLPPLLLNL